MLQSFSRPSGFSGREHPDAGLVHYEMGRCRHFHREYIRDPVRSGGSAYLECGDAGCFWFAGNHVLAGVRNDPPRETPVRRGVEPVSGYSQSFRTKIPHEYGNSLFNAALRRLRTILARGREDGVRSVFEKTGKCRESRFITQLSELL